MKKRLLSLATVLVLGSLLAIPSSMAVVRRAAYDVTGSTPYYAAIQYVREHSIATGYSDGTFRPYNNVTRAEFVAMVVKASGQNPSATAYRYCFNDVGVEWFANEVCFAKSRNWISSNSYFSPNSAITASEAQTVLRNGLGRSVSSSGYGNVTRGQAANMIYMALGYSDSYATTTGYDYRGSYDPYYDTRYDDPYVYNRISDTVYDPVTYNPYPRDPRYDTPDYYDDRYYDDRYDTEPRYSYARGDSSFNAEYAATHGGRLPPYLSEPEPPLRARYYDDYDRYDTRYKSRYDRKYYDDTYLYPERNDRYDRDVPDGYSAPWY